MRLRLVLPLIAVAALACGACIPPEPDTERIVQYDPEETVMGAIQERKKLLVGVPVDRPPFAEFAFNLGKSVGDALGVATEPIPLESDAILDAPEGQRVDIAFPVVTITERLVRHHAVTDPYYIGHQRLLVSKDSPIQEAADLDGIVCQFIDTRVGVNLREVNPAVRPIAPPDPSSCVSMLPRQVQAISASDWLLLPLLVETPGVKIVGDELTTEAYGAVVEKGASAWADFVNDAFFEAGADGDWQRYYNQAFGPYVEGEATYPDMTVEEAAALFPVDVPLTKPSPVPTEPSPAPSAVSPSGSSETQVSR